MGNKLDDFILDIKNSLPFNGLEPESVSDGKRFYFSDKEYGIPLKKCFDRLKIESKEFTPVTGHKNLKKICSVSSSARLCFLYFCSEEDAEFEAHLDNPTGGGNAAQLDAKIGNTYYECKCQEIVNGEGETLKDSYEPLLKEFFGFDKININMHEKSISGHLTDFGIDYNEDYEKTHFNVKQLFTHLIAIGQKHKNDAVALQYVFFTPNEEQQSDGTKKVYDELKAEIKAIWNSDALRAYKEYRPNVSIPDPIFVPVSEQCFAKKPGDLLDCIKKKE